MVYNGTNIPSSIIYTYKDKFFREDQSAEKQMNLCITADILEEQLARLTEQPEQRRPVRQRGPETQPRVFDRDRRLIHIGDVVTFLTLGRYYSTRGIVYRVARSGTTITTKDDRNNLITRAPRNMHIIEQLWYTRPCAIIIKCPARCSTKLRNHRWDESSQDQTRRKQVKIQ